MLSRGRELGRVLAALPFGAVRDASAGEQLAGMAAAEAAEAIGELWRLALDEVEARGAFVAVARALRWDEERLLDEQRAAIAQAADAAGLDEVARLVVLPRSASRLSGPTRPVRPGEETLGHRSQRARVERRKEALVRLALDEEPVVVRNVLLNPRATTPLAVRVAARRPVPPLVLDEVARSARFGHLPHVRRALALNPHSPADLAVLLLPLLSPDDLEQISNDPRLPALTRLAARALKRRRGDA